MGGEPTFVSIDDMDGAEWNIAAVGPDQARLRRRSGAPPARALRARRPAALRPGQVVSGRARCRAGPSRSTGARDGEPLWRDPDLIVASANRPRPAIADAEKFARRALQRTSALPADSGMPAYEDPAHFALAEQKLPLGVEPENNKLARPAERDALSCACSSVASTSRRLCAAGAGVAGARARRRWVTERWGTATRPAVSDAGRSRRSACACRSARLPEIAPSIIRTCCRAIRSPTLRRCRSDRADPAAQSGHAASRPGAAARQGERDRRRGAHRTRRRAARRAPVRVPAAAGATRRIIAALVAAIEEAAASRRAAGPPRRLRAAVRSAPQRHQGHAGSRRDRGQHPSGDDLEGSRSTSRRAVYEEARRGRDWAPRSSCSTGATSAPAAAITSCSAA